MGRIAEMKELEKQKRKKKKKIFFIVMIVIGIIIAILLHPALGAVIALTPLVVNAMIDAGEDIAKGEEDLPKKLKEELIPKLIETVLPEAQYFPYEGIHEEEYKLAEFSGDVVDYKSSDRTMIMLQADKNLAFESEVSEIEFKHEIKDKESFVYIVANTKLPKDIRSKIKIGREGAYKQGNIFKVNMSLKEFEESFDVMSPNKSLAQRVITEELMQEILNVYNTYGYILEINIIRDKLYIRVDSEKIIKNTKDGPIIDCIIMEKRYNMIKTLTSLIKDIYLVVYKTEI